MLTIEGKTVELFPSSRPGATLVVLNTVTGEGGAVYEAARKATEADFALAAIGNLRWDDDMTPWPIPPIAPGAAPCAGGAEAYLAMLTGTILPEVLRHMPERPGSLALSGYSLGGLFALYALYHTDIFDRVACVSGSLWYPGFVEYARNHEMCRRPERLCLSLGDREGRTHNPVMKPVEENTRIISEWYKSIGIPTTLEMNPGGHFRNIYGRLARGIARMLEK